MEVTENSLAVTLTVGQMHDLIRECIREELQDIQPVKEETAKYLTRLEVCKALNISLPTLSRYSELGLIPAKRIGNRILYLQSDIEASLKDRPIRKLRT
jgi:predicted transcriptional regulator